MRTVDSGDPSANATRAMSTRTPASAKPPNAEHLRAARGRRRWPATKSQYKFAQRVIPDALNATHGQALAIRSMQPAGSACQAVASSTARTGWSSSRRPSAGSRSTTGDAANISFAAIKAGAHRLRSAGSSVRWGIDRRRGTDRHARPENSRPRRLGLWNPICLIAVPRYALITPFESDPNRQSDAAEGHFFGSHPSQRPLLRALRAAPWLTRQLSDQLVPGLRHDADLEMGQAVLTAAKPRFGLASASLNPSVRCRQSARQRSQSRHAR